MIRYGIIGAGAIGRKRAAALQDGQLVSVYDSDRPRAETLLREMAQGHAAKSALEIFRSREVDAVIISTRHDSLAGLALAAMQAGKHVLVEKPAARNAAELAPLLEAEARTGVSVRVGYNHRFHPTLVAARRDRR